MRQRGAAPLVVLALLLAPALVAGQASTAGWDQLAGGAGRAGAALLPSSTLDVLGARDLFDDDTEINLRYTKGLVATPHGLVALAVRGDQCLLLHVDEADVQLTSLESCRAGTLTAYDRVNDRILVCSSALPQEPVFQSRDARTGELMWGILPGEQGRLGLQPVEHRCVGTAVVPEKGIAYVALWTDVYPPTAARVMQVQLADGTVDWQRPLSATDFMGTGVQETATASGFIPYGLSVSESGLVVSGRATCVCSKGDPGRLVGGLAGGAQDGSVDDSFTVQGAVAWLETDDGDIVGAAVAEDDAGSLQDADVPARRFGQWWAATRGPLAAFALGERMLVVNPAEREPVREGPFQGVETGEGFIGATPSAWWGDVVLVPIAKSVTAIDPGSETLEPRWSTTFGETWVVSGIIVLPPRDVLAVVASQSNGTEADTGAAIYRLDLASGDVLQRVPLPGTIRMSGGQGRLQFQPLDDGRLLVYTLDGRLFTLGSAPPQARPTLVLSTAYPAPNAPVDVRVEAPDAGARYVVAWGDDTVEDGGTAWSHRYGDAEPRTVRVTALYADGRTATSERVIHVGAPAPPELNALQTVFAPQNQNLTFGILGILVTLLGALLALYLRRRRHSVLHEELRALERIREQGRRDTEGAIRALGLYRERLLADIGAHRLDDAQFNTLEARANVVFAALRTRLLGPLAGRLSADFRHALDVVLHDGRIDAEELAHLRAALATERDLAAEERARLTALLETMAERG